MKKSTSGDQPCFEHGREGMGLAVCESAAGRGHGAPALVTLPHQASPVGGPTGCRAPRRRGTRHGLHSRTPSRSKRTSRANSARTLRRDHAWGSSFDFVMSPFFGPALITGDTK